MRIGLDAMILTPNDSGVGIFTRGLIGALAAVDRENEYVVYHGLDSGQIETGGAPNFRLVCVKVHNSVRARRIAWEQVRLPLRLREDRVDVFHAPAYVNPALVDVPSVVTVHDAFAVSHPQVCKRLNVLHYRLAVPPGLRRATVIHCLSNYTRGEVARFFPKTADKIEVVYPGIDEIFTPDGREDELAALRARLGIGPEPPFLFVGNIEPKKNLTLVFDALRILEERFGSRRPLLVVGQWGWRHEPVRAHYEASGLGDRVVWCGYVPRAELPLFYRLAACLVFPSICEGFGLPPLEAMRCGTPVVAAATTALNEVLGEAALLCSPTNPFSLAERMHAVASDPARREEYIKKGLRASARLDWGTCARRLIEIYSRIASCS